MTITEPQVEKLISGGTSVKFHNLAFNMLLTRLAKNYKYNPSPAVLQEITREVNAFLTKFEAIMQQDYALIEKL